MTNFYDQFRIEQERGAHVIQLGDWHGYPAGLFNTPGRSNTRLQVGCRTFLNAASARLHWRGGVSRDGGAPRPFAEALISLAEALCRIHGWPNWAEPLLPANPATPVVAHAMGLPQMTETREPMRPPPVGDTQQQVDELNHWVRALAERIAQLEDRLQPTVTVNPPSR